MLNLISLYFPKSLIDQDEIWCEPDTRLGGKGKVQVWNPEKGEPCIINIITTFGPVLISIPRLCIWRFYLNPQVMAQILKDMGITEYEPRVINQMLEFAFRKLTKHQNRLTCEF